jgi:hypothetical protein
VIVGLVPIGGIADSSASGAARAVAERVSRELCSRPLDAVFEIGTTVDARQCIGAEVLIVVLWSMAASTRTSRPSCAVPRCWPDESPLPSRCDDGPRTPTWSTLASNPRCSRPMLPVCYRDSISPRRPTPASRRRVAIGARFLIPSLWELPRRGSPSDVDAPQSGCPRGLRLVPDRGSGQVRRRSRRPRRDGCGHVRTRLGRTRSTCSRRRESSVSDPLVPEIALPATLGEPAWTTARVTA